MYEQPTVQRSHPLVAKVSTRRRSGHLILNWLAFSLCYPLGNLLAQQQQVRRSLALPIDAAIPFVPWMILPYLTSSIFFALVFFLVHTQEQLRVASRRLLMATVAGCLVFVVAPARFSLLRPPETNTVPAALFRLLDLVDQPYNQFPSLHVAYCLIFWFALRPLSKGLMRTLLAAWLWLVGASTIFTWQHHLLDVAGGLLLGSFVIYAVRPGATCRSTVSFYYAILAGMLLLAGFATQHSWVAAYAAASMLLVAAAYRARNADFLLKHAGRHPLLRWLMFWPYLAGYRLTWILVRLRERRRPSFTKSGPGLWIGRRLTSAEAKLLPAECHVIDLCTELSETATLCGERYHHIPLLDLQAPSPQQLRKVMATLAQLHENGAPVYVHCAMGYSRCRLIARLYHRKGRQCPTQSTS
ncbi:phosphatase PAP2/dual specificity phosphatase family protein [Massilia sp. H6]|uniref:phosphatase PAP2/dual specificity phosphatase family protein n=1 Tax=Massilia sp. H6 TaxID=2970464 RepID=UPI00216AAEB8|nr:phosphatase PAP2/dual specificity phosphatase family protein [Massilia sp. H6]UVW27250.1 phosphatase PAP2/dual specificity phosphatase family protein [Massilia sp. H6]